MSNVPLTIRSTAAESLMAALANATGAAFLLGEAHVTVVEARVRNGHATLFIDRPPPFVTGALHVRRFHDGRSERVMVAAYHGCTLEWLETAELVRQVSA